jgi:SOS response regulatory protein OraA/RecX
MSSLKPEARAAARYTRAGVRSTSEVRAYLKRRGLSVAIAQRIVADLVSRGALDDQACAKLWASHLARAGYAWVAIQRRLSAKGLDDETIGQVGRSAGIAPSDAERARQIVAERLRGLQKSHRTRGTAAKDLNRLARFLRSRGFDQDVIEQVLSEAGLVFHPPPQETLGFGEMSPLAAGGGCLAEVSPSGGTKAGTQSTPGLPGGFHPPLC